MQKKSGRFLRRANRRENMIEKYIDAAAGNKKAELVLKNGSFVNVFTGEIVRADIAVEGGKIVGFGDYEGE